MANEAFQCDKHPPSAIRRVFLPNLILFLLVWLAITAWHHDVLWLPPYEEQCTGLWYEVDFLVESGFDYHRLRYEEPHFMSPKVGARSYMISLVPTFFALLILACPTLPLTYFVGHLAMFAFASVTIVALHAMLRPTVGLIPSIVLCAAVLATPSYAVQIEMLGMEIPMIAFSVLAVLFLWRGHFAIAALFSTLGFLMKVNAILVTASSAAYLLYLWRLGSRDAQSKRRAYRGLVWHALALAFQLGLSWWGDTSFEARQEVRTLYGGLRGILGIRNAIHWCPELVVLFFVGLGMLLLGMLYRHKDPVSGKSVPWSWRSEEGDSVFPLMALGWVITLLWTASMASYIFTPRYAAGTVPFLYLAAGLTLFRFPWRRSIPLTFFLVLVGFNLANSSGRFLPSIADVGKETFAENPFTRPRWCILLERSREYLPDLHANLEAMQTLEREHADVPMLMTGPYAFYAGLPKLGYVQKPLQVERVANFPDALRATERYATKEGARSGLSPLYVWFGAALAFFPPPEPGDAILFEDRSPYPVKFYRKPIPAGTPIEAWYLEKTWPATDRSRASFGRIAYLQQKGDFERLLEELRCLMRRHPDDAEFPILYKSIKNEMDKEGKSDSHGPAPARGAPADTSSRLPIGHDKGMISYFASGEESFLIQGNAN